MSDVVIVDWLGRGGIAQCSAAWAQELTSRGVAVTVVTRSGRAQRHGATDVVSAGDDRHAILAHRAVALAAERTIRELSPSTVVVQNHVIPPMERRVHAAARAVGARVITVVHDHRMHSPLAGTTLGLGSLVRQADVVVAHSEFVARGVRSLSGRPDVTVLPHPVPVTVVGGAPRTPRPRSTAGAPLALHFGVLKRGYKGTRLVVELARTGVPPWRFALLGVGAPTRVPGVEAVDAFLSDEELVGRVEAATACLLPYRFATQSGAVVLAQALGAVPIASAVGGIPEQIVDGSTGRLLPPGAPAELWREVLDELAEEGRAEEIAAGARRAVWRDHDAFVAGMLRITGVEHRRTRASA